MAIPGLDAILGYLGMGANETVGQGLAGAANMSSSLPGDALLGFAPQSVVGDVGNQMAGLTDVANMPIGMAAVGNQLIPGATNNINSLFGKDGIVGFLKGDAFKNTFKAGTDLYNIGQTKKDSKHLRRMDNANLDMAQGTYAANMADRERDANLNF